MYVFDTNVIVAGLRSRRGASFLILEALAHGTIRGAASAALILEYQDVLLREINVGRFWAGPKEVDVVLGVLAKRLRPVVIHFRWRPQLRDPDDEMILECAVNGTTRGIVTFNVGDFHPAADRFGLDVLRPGEFVRAFNLESRRWP